MSKPTLGVVGKLIAYNGDPTVQAELNKWIPYQYVINWIKERQQKSGLRNRVLILKSETASGKSTLLPSELFKELVYSSSEGAPGLVCTQPRILTAIRNPIGIAAIPDYKDTLKLGKTIGWKTQMSKLKCRVNAFNSVTIGTLNMQLSTLMDDEIIALYKIIMIDEVHERDLETDMTLYRLKDFLMRNVNNPGCPYVICMSATFEPASFISYFGLSMDDNFIWCQGRGYPIDDRWDWNEGRTINNFPQAAAMIVEMIADEGAKDEPERGDILIFMPGVGEIKQTIEWLNKLNGRLATAKKPVMSVMMIDSESQQRDTLDYRKLDIPLIKHTVTIGDVNYKPIRRAIVSTAFAETGVTIGSLKYVIDAGYSKEIEYNPIYNVRALISKPAQKPRIGQRRGRAGRLFPGVFYPLYPQYIFDMLPDKQLPKILLEDISMIMMHIIAEQLRAKTSSGINTPEFLIEDIDMIDRPSMDAIHAALEKLYLIGFIDPNSPPLIGDIREVEPREGKFGISKLGRLSLGFGPKISPESARMILAAYSWGPSVLDMITIAAYLLIDDIKFVASKAKIEGGRTKSHEKSLNIGRKKDIILRKKNPKKGINWTEIYKLGAPDYLSVRDLYKIRLMVADEFIDGIFLFNAIRKLVSGGNMGTSIAELQQWCGLVNLNYDAVISFIRERDDIIESMLGRGFDVFSSESKSLIHCGANEFTNAITRIKYSIYDGYRRNIIVRRGNSYYTEFGGIQVMPPTIFKEDEQKIIESTKYEFVLKVFPQILIYRSLAVKNNLITGVYDVIAERVSALDGYVNHDNLFGL